MGLVVLVIGLAVFIGAHVFVTFRDARAAVIARMGEGPYKGVFSLVALVGILLIAYGFAEYRAAGFINLWDPPTWMRHLTAVLVWPAIVFAVAAYIPGEIKRRLKHPLLVGVKLWAVAHLLANGDLGSIMLFGSLLAWAVYDRITLKHRNDPGAPPIPIRGYGNDAVAFTIGTLLYLALGLWFHPYVIGAPAFGS
jgi:uncharacterized membrane protein